MVSSTASSSAMATQGFFTFLLMLLPSIVIYGAIAYALYLLIRALRKYLSEKPANQETAAVRKSLGETIKEHRTRCNMTQEFVAEHLGVSRQAVSKWESGASDPIFHFARCAMRQHTDLHHRSSHPPSGVLSACECF